MKTIRHLLRTIVGVALLCAGASAVPARDSGPDDARPAAIARLGPTAGHRASGTVRFFAQEEGIRVLAEFTGLTPGDHGMHIHENGDCSAPDASSAGDHFNPKHAKHGDRAASERHAGDLGNITARDDGTAHLEYVDTHLSLSGPDSIIGRSVIVHAGPDDLTSQPSGNSGARVACGIIEQP